MTVDEWLGHEELPITIWKNKYRHGDESFDEWLDRVTNGNNHLKKIIEDKKFIFAGRILANRGVKDRKLTLSNCYVVTPPEDNLESIFEAGSKLARTFSFGGGVGLDVSKLRPRGAEVHNSAKTTSGSTSFMDFYSYITGLIGQDGRRGATMLSISCDHPDLEEFINLKSDLELCTKANISVRVSDKFMEAVVKDDDYLLKWPVDLDTSVEWVGSALEYDKLTPYYKGDELMGYVKKVKPKKLFDLLAFRNWEMAEPGILYWDTISNYNLLEGTDFQYAGVNPCVTADTRILTKNGYVPIVDVVDKDVEVWNGYEWSIVTPKLMGTNQPVYNVVFSDGSNIKCTDYHKFPINTGSYRKPVDTRKELKDIVVGDKLMKCSFPVIEGEKSIGEKSMYTQGFFGGDGYDCGGRNAKYIKFYGEKVNCVQYCDTVNQRYVCPEYTEYSVNVNFPKDFVPTSEYTIEDRLNWLAGIVDSDGTLNDATGSISICSINRNFLMDIKYMLNTLGVTSTVSLIHERGKRTMPTHNDNICGEYECQSSYRVIISSFNVLKLYNLGFHTHRVKLNPQPNRDAGRFITVKSITKEDGLHSVYCFNEPKNHTFIANGCITGNCAEEPLPAGGSCLLGSINLSEFVLDPFTKNARINFEELKSVTRCAVTAMNEVLIEGLPLHPLQEQRKAVADWHQIGLGTMGMADCLIKLGLKYDSDEALIVIEEIYKAIATESIIMSKLWCDMYGCFPKGTEEFRYKMVNSKFIKNLNLDEELLKEIEEDGLYNSQLLTCAPTGSISTMFQVSGGVEPNFAFSYNRRTLSLNNKETVYKVDAKIVQDYKKVTGNTTLPDYFVASHEIDPFKRIKVQSMLQKYIDASISSTINLPNETTPEQVRDIYMYAWHNNLKGVTIWRDGCKRQAILSTDNKKQEKQEKTEKPKEKEKTKTTQVRKVSDDCVGKKRTLNTGCGTLHLTAFFDKKTGQLLETYFSKGSKGGCALFMVGLSRMVSLAARANIAIEEIIDQLKSSGTCPAYAVRTATKKDTSKGSCCPVAIGYALMDMYKEMQKELGLYKSQNNNSNKQEKQDEPKTNSPKCPECGEPLQTTEGCMSCRSCGYSKC